MQARFLYGMTGTGKTLRAVMLAVIDYYLGRDIWGNLHLKNIPYRYIEILDLIDLVVNKKIDSRPKTLILDEIQTAFDGRRSSSNQNYIMSLFVSQCRKRGFNILYTSQFITGADPRMRTLTDKLTECFAKKSVEDIGLGTFEEPEPTKLTYLTINPKNPFSKVKKKSLVREQFRPFYKYYNTHEIIRPTLSYAGGE